MNENIDLTKILKDCPIGWEFYSSIHGDVTFRGIENNSGWPIKFFFFSKDKVQRYGSVTEQGLYAPYYYGECTFFPSKDQRDWSKFTAPWYKKGRFDPNTLQPFDKVLVRMYDKDVYTWEPDFFGYIDCKLIMCVSNEDVACILPYNEDTKHLIGTTEEAPEYYRYWDDCV